MKVTLSTVNGDVYVLEVPADMELENFKVCRQCNYGGVSGRYCFNAM